MFELILKGYKCTWCGDCTDVCPSGALSLIDDLLSWDNEKCHRCEICTDICDVNALEAKWE